MRLLPWTLILAVLVPATVFAGLNQAFQQSGNLGLAVVGAAGNNMQIVGGTFNLTGLPPTATIVRATLYASEINQFSGLDAQFGGANLGSVGPSASDAAFNTLYTYQWNVTSQVVAALTS